MLFAFFTNKKWVFTDAEEDVSTFRRLVTFSAGRLITLGIDYAVTLFGALMLSKLIPALVEYSVLGITLNMADLISKVVAAVIVIVCNYFFSKLFVFKKAGTDKTVCEK